MKHILKNDNKISPRKDIIIDTWKMVKHAMRFNFVAALGPHTRMQPRELFSQCMILFAACETFVVDSIFLKILAPNFGAFALCVVQEEKLKAGIVLRSVLAYLKQWRASNLP